MVANITCHSGGAIGSDTHFEKNCIKYNIVIRAYTYKTPYHQSPFKYEISDDLFQEGIIKVREANKILKRYGYQKYMNLLARNWAQIKYTKEVFAIGSIRNNLVEGGYGWAVSMAIQKQVPLYVFEQMYDKWYRWSYITGNFIPTDDVLIKTDSFTGIGTRKLISTGENAIDELFKRSFSHI